jgi:hypothetical protein
MTGALHRVMAPLRRILPHVEADLRDGKAQLPLIAIAGLDVARPEVAILEGQDDAVPALPEGDLQGNSLPRVHKCGLQGDMIGLNVHHSLVAHAVLSTRIVQRAQGHLHPRGSRGIAVDQ